jgi:hypothetical protein
VGAKKAAGAKKAVKAVRTVRAAQSKSKKGPVKKASKKKGGK